MKFKLGLIQTVPSWNYNPEELEHTILRVRKLAEDAKNKGADVISLPEMWVSPYSNKAMSLFSEERGGKAYRALASIAKENNLWVIGGTIPERSNGKLYNTCFVFDPEGKEVARQSKNHLFEIHIPGKQEFSEAEIYTPGEGITVFDTPWAKIGVAVCFDVRFRDPIELEALSGANLIVLPASFGTSTGKAHWDMLIMSRAVDSQVYFAGNNAARDLNAPYQAWGHSMVYDPWGEKVGELDEGEEILICEIDTDRVRTIRERLPILEGKRKERNL